MTPEQRRQKLEAAKAAEAAAQALINEVEADETTTAPAQPVSAPVATTGTTTSAAQTAAAKASAPAVAKPAATAPAPVPAAVRATETGPGGNTRKAGPSLFQTLQSVAAKMKATKK